jgi:hypothetical protein
VAGRVTSWLTAVLSTAVLGGACAKDNAATDFCHSYGDAVRGMVAAARQYSANPANFAAAYKSTMDSLDTVRAKAPDDKLRTAFDKAMFTFSVFSGDDKGLADFITRADFSNNAVVQACAEDGVEIAV